MTPPLNIDDEMAFFTGPGRWNDIISPASLDSELAAFVNAHQDDEDLNEALLKRVSSALDWSAGVLGQMEVPEEALRLFWKFLKVELKYAAEAERNHTEFGDFLTRIVDHYTQYGKPQTFFIRSVLSCGGPMTFPRMHDSDPNATGGVVRWWVAFAAMVKNGGKNPERKDIVDVYQAEAEATRIGREEVARRKKIYDMEKELEALRSGSQAPPEQPAGAAGDVEESGPARGRGAARGKGAAGAAGGPAPVKDPRGAVLKVGRSKGKAKAAPRDEDEYQEPEEAAAKDAEDEQDADEHVRVKGGKKTAPDGSKLVRTNGWLLPNDISATPPSGINFNLTEEEILASKPANGPLTPEMIFSLPEIHGIEVAISVDPPCPLCQQTGQLCITRGGKSCVGCTARKKGNCNMPTDIELPEDVTKAQITPKRTVRQAKVEALMKTGHISVEQRWRWWTEDYGGISKETPAGREQSVVPTAAPAKAATKKRAAPQTKVKAKPVAKAPAARQRFADTDSDAENVAARATAGFVDRTSSEEDHQMHEIDAAPAALPYDEPMLTDDATATSGPSKRRRSSSGLSAPTAKRANTRSQDRVQTTVAAPAAPAASPAPAGPSRPPNPRAVAPAQPGEFKVPSTFPPRPARPNVPPPAATEGQIALLNSRIKQLEDSHDRLLHANISLERTTALNMQNMMRYVHALGVQPRVDASVQTDGQDEAQPMEIDDAPTFDLPPPLDDPAPFPIPDAPQASATVSAAPAPQVSTSRGASAAPEQRAAPDSTAAPPRLAAPANSARSSSQPPTTAATTTLEPSRQEAIGDQQAQLKMPPAQASRKTTPQPSVAPSRAGSRAPSAAPSTAPAPSQPAPSTRAPSAAPLPVAEPQLGSQLPPSRPTSTSLQQVVEEPPAAPAGAAAAPPIPTSTASTPVSAASSYAPMKLFQGSKIGWGSAFKQTPPSELERTRSTGRDVPAQAASQLAGAEPMRRVPSTPERGQGEHLALRLPMTPTEAGIFLQMPAGAQGPSEEAAPSTGAATVPQRGRGIQIPSSDEDGEGSPTPAARRKKTTTVIPDSDEEMQPPEPLPKRKVAVVLKKTVIPDSDEESDAPPQDEGSGNDEQDQLEAVAEEGSGSERASGEGEGEGGSDGAGEDTHAEEQQPQQLSEKAQGKQPLRRSARARGAASDAGGSAAAPPAAPEPAAPVTRTRSKGTRGAKK
ncbi:unnamed protein product [Peniophora sp. CBMAI 1063]|nr:unnamed protein product [Peniophora sp. CBMAI 1063]